MPVIPELMPDCNDIKVVFDDKLLGIEFDEESVERDALDSFWASVFYASIDNNERAVLGSSAYQLIDLQVLPSDYNLESKTVNVMIQSFVESKGRSGLLAGPTTHASLNLEGDIVLNWSVEARYSKSFSAHIRKLLAETALAYDPLETDSLR